jgi:DNA-binding NarL/FixJ family response regulator
VTEGSIRVFIVDDHPLVREWLGNLLRLETDFEVIGEAADGARGLAAMLRLRPDVAIVDLSLPRSSGLELIKDLRSNLPDTQVLVLSMREEIGDVERAFRAGARGYVMKRQSTGEIVPAIRAVHAEKGHLYADPAILGALASRMLHRPLNQDSASPEVLTDRELEVFRRVGDGWSTRRISDELQISLSTVHTYYGRIREKLGMSEAAELVRAAVQWNDGHH